MESHFSQFPKFIGFCIPLVYVYAYGFRKNFCGSYYVRFIYWSATKTGTIPSQISLDGWIGNSLTLYEISQWDEIWIVHKSTHMFGHLFGSVLKLEVLGSSVSNLFSVIMFLNLIWLEVAE